MKPSTSWMSSPTFTYATTCTVPTSISALSSSVTPFYPRSYSGSSGNYGYEYPPNSVEAAVPQVYEPYPTKPQEIDANIHEPREEVTAERENTEFYSNPAYVSLGSEAYGVSWAPNGFYCGDSWSCAGNWQWCHPAAPVEYVYAETDNEQQTYVHPTTYRAPSSAAVESASVVKHTFNFCPTASTTSVPGKGVAVAPKSTVPVKPFFQPNPKGPSTGFQGSSKTNSQVNVLVQDGFKKEVLNEAGVAKDDNKDVLVKLSSQASLSTDVKPRIEHSTKMVADKSQTSEISEKFKAKLTFSESIRMKDLSMEPTSSKPLEDNRSFSPVTCTQSRPKEVLQGISQNFIPKCNDNSTCSSSCSTHSQRSSDYISSKPQPKINQEACFDSSAYAVKTSSSMERGELRNEEVTINMLNVDKVDPTIHPSKSISNGHYLLIKSIYHLSKVLVANQSNAHNHVDMPIEKSIYMLSQCLSQSLALNDDGYQEPQQNAEFSFDPDVATDDALVQSVLKCLDPFRSTQDHDMLPPSRQDECRKGHQTKSFNVHSNFNGNDCMEVSALKKQMLDMKSDLAKLQEEISYERTESNTTVLAYKNLWSEAQAEADACKSEIVKMKADIEALTQASRKLKNTGGSIGPKGRTLDTELIGNCDDAFEKRDCYQNFPDDSYNSGHNFMTQFLHRKSDSEDGVHFLRNSGTCLSKNSGMQPGCFTDTETVQLDTKCMANENADVFGTAKSKLEAPIAQRLSVLLARRPLDTKCMSNENADVFGTGNPKSNLEAPIAQRLSVLLERRPLDLNVTCTDTEYMDVAVTDGNLSTDYSTLFSQEGETKEPILKVQETYFQGGTWCPAGAVDVQQTSWLRQKQTKRGLCSEGMEFENSTKVWQEDESEIICLRPNDSDNHVTLIGETEWEHIEVNKSLFT